MRGLFATATAVFQVVLYKRVQCSASDPYDDDKTTVFNDPIHGHIELPAIVVRIINTPEFLRLRNIKQLGATYEVFPGAAHNRFEHCLGVCHLAGIFGKHLQQQIDEELKKQEKRPKQQIDGVTETETSDVTKKMIITKEDIVCLQIAGLCHDLGHGPMSHAFESHFIKKLDPSSKWTHEEGSLTMFDHLLKKNKIKIDSHDIGFIKKLIHRNTEEEYDTGRPKEKDFLYEVISNDENGIDVDKWDYFARDSYHLGFRNNFDHHRLMKFSRVIKVDGEWHICYRDKQVEDIYHMFMSRVILHRRACQHKTTQILERMYMEALIKANDHYLIKAPDGVTKWKISECIKFPEAFSQLTDHIFWDIRNSSDENLKEAKEILKRIDTRKHYKLVSEALSKRDEKTGLQEEAFNKIVERSKPKQSQKEVNEKDEKSPKIDLRQVETQILNELSNLSKGELKIKDLAVDIAVFNYGKGESNPVDKVYFYNKAGKDQKYRAFHMPRDNISYLLPRVYLEHHIRLYIKTEDQKLLEEAGKWFKVWCEEQEMNVKCRFPELPTDK